MRRAYYHRHEQWANICEMVSATTPAQRLALDDRGYERLSREQLRRHVHWLNDENDAWGSGRATGRYSPDDIKSFGSWADERDLEWSPREKEYRSRYPALG